MGAYEPCMQHALTSASLGACARNPRKRVWPHSLTIHSPLPKRLSRHIKKRPHPPPLLTSFFFCSLAIPLTCFYCAFFGFFFNIYINFFLFSAASNKISSDLFFLTLNPQSSIKELCFFRAAPIFIVASLSVLLSQHHHYYCPIPLPPLNLLFFIFFKVFIGIIIITSIILKFFFCVGYSRWFDFCCIVSLKRSPDFVCVCFGYLSG